MKNMSAAQALKNLADFVVRQIVKANNGNQMTLLPYWISELAELNARRMVA